jgi:transcriptional regulator with XRE-family HTH domain
MTPRQSRAARGALGWSMRDLASHSGLALQTVHRFEAGEELREETMARIESAFIAGGLLLIDPDGIADEGIRFRKQKGRSKKR